MMLIPGWHRKLLIIWFVIAASVGPTFVQAQATPPVDATESVLFSVRPDSGLDGDRFEVEVTPGQSVDLTLVMENLGNIAIELDSYTADIRTAPNGGLTMNQPDLEQHEPTTWMAFPRDTVALEPGAQAMKTFTITVPEDATPGQYVNAIAVQTVDDYAIEGSTMFRQRVRKVLAVYITVPGEMNGSFILGQPLVEIRPRGPVIQIPLENTGNVRVRPAGQMTIDDPMGVELVSAPVAIGSVYAGHSTVIEIDLPAVLPPGEYHLSLELKDEEWGASASLVDATLIMPEPEEEASVAPVAIQSVAVTPNGDPIQFANLAVEIQNNAEIVPGARLTVSVSRDGEHVEDFILADSLALNLGLTTVEQRYIPVTGFEAGTWVFTVKLEALNPNTGVATVLVIQEDAAVLEVP